MKDKELQMVSFEQAKRLKEVGFDWDVEFGYNDFHTEIPTKEEFQNLNEDIENDIPYFSAPTVALALKWFRDVKKILNSVELTNSEDYHGIYNDKYRNYKSTPKIFDTYEAAESALLDELLQLIEK